MERRIALHGRSAGDVEVMQFPISEANKPRFTSALPAACDVVVLGGGISHAGEFLLRKIIEKIPGLLMFKTLPYPRVALARLGNEAGVIGAAMLGKLGMDYVEGGI